MVEKYIFLAAALAPIWFPLVRFLATFLLSRKRWNRPCNWAYAITLVWSGGLVWFFWVSRMPSGIPYGIVLLVGWIVLLLAIVLDVSLTEEAQPTQDIEHGETGDQSHPSI